MPPSVRSSLVASAVFGLLALLSPRAEAQGASASAPAVVLPMEATTTATLEAIRKRAVRWSSDRRWMALDARTLGEAPFRLAGSAKAPSFADALVDFAKAELVPPPGTADDDRVACRQPARWRLLQKLASGEGVDLPAAPSCTAMAAFADPAVVVGLEVLFVALTSAQASASFGHLLLRLVRGPEPEIHDVVYEISAITGFRDSSLAYVGRGLSGAYPLVFDPQTLSSALADNLHGQQRNIQRFALNVTAAQRRTILQLLWQVERDLALPYRFLNRNCATYLLWLLSTALDDAPEVGARVRLAASPAEILNRMADIAMPHDGEPLLRHEPGGFESSNSHRLRAVASARAIRKRLDALPAPLGPRWRASDALGPDALAALALATVAALPTHRATIERLLQARVIAARAELDSGQAAAVKVDRERVRPRPDRPLPDLAHLLEWRRLAYLREDKKWRRDQQIARLLWIDDYAATAPRRAANRAERDILAGTERARAAFVCATDGYLATADALDWASPPDLEREWRDERQHEEARQWRGTLVRSPARLLGLRATLADGALRSGWGAVLTTAFWREELGQMRPHGVGPTRSFVLADIETELGVDGDGVRWLGNRARLFEVASMSLVPAAEDGWLRHLGWVDWFGWGVQVHSAAGPKASNASVRLDGYALLLDGLSGPWLVGVRAGLRPMLALRGGRIFDAALLAEPFAQRRIGSLGRLAASMTMAQTWWRRDAQAALALEVPMGRREAWWARLGAVTDCDAAWRCRWSSHAGVLF